MSATAFAKREFCNRDCRTAWRHKHPEEERGVFPKGNVPHNKGVCGRKPWMNTKGLVPGWNKGLSQSEKTRQKIRVARARQDMSSRRGAGHPNWKGGRSLLRKRIQALYEYKNWRTTVFKRDDYTCRHCSQRGGKLNADHIKSFASIISENNITTVEQAKACSQLWDVDNGQTLCVQCHQKTRTYGSQSIVVG